jgi:hypothetical protein
MKIEITITNPSAAVLKALGVAVTAQDDSGSVLDFIRHIAGQDQDVDNTTGQPDDVAEPTPAGHITADNLGDLTVGDPVHWAGASFTFDGTVKSVTPDAADGKVVRLIRGDTGKTVSLTADDLDIYNLTLIG